MTARELLIDTYRRLETTITGSEPDMQKVRSWSYIDLWERVDEDLDWVGENTQVVD